MRELGKSPPLILDKAHSLRLNMLASETLYGAARLASSLRKEATRLVVVPSHEMPDDVVSIGSDVTFGTRPLATSTR
jgi:hypothetical protein